MFRLADEGVIDESAVDDWALNVHLTVVTDSNTLDQPSKPNNYDENDINFIADHLEETTFSHYVSASMEAQNTYACHASKPICHQPVRREVQFEDTPRIINSSQVGLKSILPSVLQPNKHDTSSTLFAKEDVIDCSHLNKSKLHRSTQHNIVGFCVDIGAPRSVIALKELNRITDTSGFKSIPTYPSGRRYLFGDNL